MEGAPSRRRAIKKGRTTTAAATTGKTISDLPDHIICDILSRLPLKSIFRCRRVCKTWRNLLLEPYFAKLHISRSPLSLILYRPSDRKNPSHFGVLELDNPARLRRRNATMKFGTEIQIPHSDLEIESLCNGSICLSDSRSRDTVIVCNPIRGQHFILPKPPNKPAQVFATGYGFGYSPSTDQYKVLRFTKTHSPSYRFECDIYKFGNDDGWRSIGSIGQPSPPDFGNFVYLNGAVHWIGLEDDSGFICYVDIEKEKFGNLSLPSHIGDLSYMHIGVVDNFLYICDDYGSPSCVNIWVMKDYRNIGSLTLEWVIELPFPHGLIDPVKPIKILKDGTVLMIFHGKTLGSYNPETRVVERIKYHGVRFWKESFAGVPSFLSPMDAIR